MRHLRYAIAIIFLFVFASTSACSCNDETGTIDNQGDGVCTPGEAECDDGAVLRCNEDGTGYLEPESCGDWECIDGYCGCSTTDDCGDGEVCHEGGVCACYSGEYCAGTCCDDGEVCAEIEICDDGQCQNVSVCRPACEGSFCGADGDICCEGDTPVCGPTGQCAPDCSAGGGLCGEDFDECCPWGDVCVFGECRTMGEPCDDLWDCDFGEYCDPGLGRCMADDFPGDIECRQEGDFQELDIVEKWSWTERDIISIPVVGDVTGDGEPNVVVNSTRDGVNNWQVGYIYILDSQGNQLHSVPHDPANNFWGSQGRSNIALADVTGDGILEIVYASRNISGSHIVALSAADGDLETVWVAHNAAGNPVSVNPQNGAITVANFDGDSSRAQIVVGAMLIDHDGLVMWNQDGDGPYFGTNAGYTGGVAVVADLTGDGQHEIVTGRHAWTVDWPSGASHPNDVNVELMWAHDGPDGYPAVADMNGNGLPEVVLVAAQTVRILEGTTGELVCGVDPTGQACEADGSLRTQPIYLPGPANNNRGGPPTVADFTGDGRPEIGVAGGHYYAVFDFNRPGFGDDDSPEDIDTDLLAEYNLAPPESGELFIRWQRETRDYSSNATGSSVFDFQGDGSASVIYSDECFMRVYSGTDGEVELEIMNSTGTILEYPLVVDVDGNGRSEILVVANDIDHCSGFVPGYQTRQGLFVYEDPNDRWVRTRSIWNQHAYSIDNIQDDGRVPDVIPNWWETHNSFRNNRQGEVPLNAADVAVTAVQTNSLLCPPSLRLQVTVENQGVAAIGADMPISLYDVDNSQYLYTTTIGQPISPGGIITVEIEYEVPTSRFNTPINLMVIANDDGSGDGEGEGLVYDCNPDKAAFAVDTLECRIEL